MSNYVKQIDLIEKEIEGLIKSFKENPDIFLTEEDIRCHLVSRLLQHKQFSGLSDTANRSRSIPVHTEVRWYGRNGNFKYRSDIVCFDTSTLRTKKGFNLPSKGYAFYFFYAVIELKLRRMSNRSNKEYLKMIEDDHKKLRTLISDVESTVDVKYYLLCFDKKTNLSPALLRYQGDRSIDFRYIFKLS